MASSPEPNLPEHIGDFSIHGVLGRGGMGVVFDASLPGASKATHSTIAVAISLPNVT